MLEVIRVKMFLGHILFRAPESKAHILAQSVFITGLYLIGIAHWVLFFNFGELTLAAHDWLKEDAYLNTIREAQIIGVLPWRWSEPFYHGTQNFLANPEVMLLPDIMFLRWLPNSVFVITHIIILYTIGFFGSLLLAKEFRSSLIALTFFWLIFNFNGYITSHLAIGHFQWSGYFLLPFFFILITRIIKDSYLTTINIAYVLAMALLLGMLFLNGSVHFAVWCSLFMLLIVFWNKTLFQSVLLSIIIGGLIGANRLIPAALFFPSKNHDFTSGYPSLSSLLDAFTSLRLLDFPEIGGGFSTMHWWEYDIFIGFIAFFMLLICLKQALRPRRLLSKLPIYVSGGLFFIFSLGNIWAIVAKSPIPFSDIERASSRFIIMPFILLVIDSMRVSDLLFRARPKIYKLAAIIGLPFMASELATHSIFWRVKNLEALSGQVNKPRLSILPNYDLTYAFSVYAGWSISIISLSAVVILLYMKRNLIRLAFCHVSPLTLTGHSPGPHELD